jgi:hypothetical protein
MSVAMTMSMSAQGWENERKETPFYSNYCSPLAAKPEPGMGDMRCNFAGMLKTVDDGFRNGE